MGLEPNNERSQPIVRKIFPPQKKPFHLPRDRLEDSQPESFGNRFYKAWVSQGRDLAMTKEESSWPHRSFPAPTPKISETFCFFSTPHGQPGQSMTVRIRWSGCSYWRASAWGKSLQSQHPRKQPHLALGHWGHGGCSIQGHVLPGPGTRPPRPSEGGTAQSLLHFHISPGACWKHVPFDSC